MFDPSEAIEKLQAEIYRTLKEFSKAKNIDEKLKLSELLKNLTQSLNVYFDFLSTVIDSELDSFDEEEDIYFRIEAVIHRFRRLPRGLPGGRRSAGCGGIRPGKKSFPFPRFPPAPGPG